MTGFGKRSMKRNTSCPRDAVALPLIGVICASSAMSAPATNAFSPPPVTMTAFTLSSSRAALNALSISATVCALSAFRTLGRSIVTIRTPSRVSVLTFSMSLHLIECHRLLAAVLIKTRAALSAESSGEDHLAQQRRRRESLLAVLIKHHVADVVSRVEADVVEQREWPHRIVAAEDHGLVNILNGPDAFFVRADRVEDVRHEQAIDDEAGVVAARHRILPERLRE